MLGSPRPVSVAGTVLTTLILGILGASIGALGLLWLAGVTCWDQIQWPA
jgi:hypothetical protein